jgi:2-dehydropantoate 2-reductase
MSLFFVIGGGAVGAFYGARLSAAGHGVYMSCGSNYPVVEKRGFRILSAGRESRFSPDLVLPAGGPVVLPERPDFVLVATKATANERVADCLPGWFEAPPVVCLFQNGIDIEAPFLSRLPGRSVISVVPYIAVTQTAPGEIHHYALGDVAIGAVPAAGAQGEVARLAQALGSSGIRCTVAPDIRAVRWQKAVWNVAFNGVSALTGGLGLRSLLRHPKSRELIRQLIAEASRVAGADGYPMPPDYAEFLLQRTSAMPDYVPSTALDLARGKEMEMDALFGSMLRIARRDDVQTPRLQFAAGLLSLLGSLAAETARSAERAVDTAVDTGGR